MATTAATVSVAAAAAASKIIKCGGVRLSISRRISTANFNHHRQQFSIKSETPRLPMYNRLSCFCSSSTTVNAADEPTAVSTGTATSSESGSEGDGVSIKDVAKVLDIRVGRITKAWRHEEADSLYVEEVDVGEDEPRTICSGLVKYIPLDHLQDRKVVVLANLKPRNMRGVKSSGMLMAASDASHENVELLQPPNDSIPGERVWFGSEEDKDNQVDPASPNQIQKKKIWESVQPHLKTDDSCVAMLEGHLMRTSAGVVVSTSLKNANIS